MRAHTHKQPPAEGHHGIKQRSEKLRQELVQTLGVIAFNEAYRILRDRYRRNEREEHTPADDDQIVQARMRKLLGKCADKYPAIEQLIFMEESGGM